MAGLMDGSAKVVLIEQGHGCEVSTYKSMEELFEHEFYGFCSGPDYEEKIAKLRLEIDKVERELKEDWS